MVKQDLLKRLKALGLPFFETETTEDANQALADVVSSHDLRFWEGFPVVLANAVARNLFNYGQVLLHLKNPKDKDNFNSLLALSLALYKESGVKFSWANALYDSLSSSVKKERGFFIDAFKKKGGFRVGNRELSSERVKAVFNVYLNQSDLKLNELVSAKEELGLEYALSQVFSPKQKDLFLKRLKGEKLTKTEKEYFSRTVKKKVMALANPVLHRLANKLLE